MKHIDKVRKYMKSTPIFDTRSVALLTGDKEYAYVLLNHLIKTGEIKRLTKGCYTVHEEPSLIVYCMKPAYIGLEDAMSLRNIWEQETCAIVITTRKARCGVREIFGNNVTIRRISPRHFFGYDYIKYGDLLMPVSDVEKTFIDMAYFNRIRKDTAKLFKMRLDMKKLREYLKKYDKRFQDKVLALLE